MRSPNQPGSPAGPLHLIADLAGCEPAVLDDEARLREIMLEAARRGRAQVVEAKFHRFDGGGITGVVMVKESHLTIHTWPERGYAAVDVFLCGRARPRRALAHLERALGAAHVTVREHVRSEAVGDVDAVAGRPRSATASQRRFPMLAVYGITLVVATCSMVYELLLAQTLSSLLGNTVLRYSLTIGCYLGALGVGALLCPPRPYDAPRRLTRVELALSLLGGLSVPLFYLFDMVQRYLVVAGAGTPWQLVGPIAFLVVTFGTIIAIGLLSGFEVPLLLALGEQARPRSANRVLGVDYLGALVGSVLFPLFLLRSLGLLTTAFAVALLNVGAAFVLIAWLPQPRRARLAVASAGMAVLLVVGLVQAGPIEQYFLKKFYYFRDADSLASLVAPQDERPEIVRYRTPYQTIDLVTERASDQWLYDHVSDDHPAAEEYPRDLWMYLNRDYQVYSGSEEVYHEWFVHAPVQANGKRPRRVLVLGGGDGLVVREVLKYDPERVVHVDIDPDVLRLAREHPVLSAMNGGAGGTARVEQVADDAFRWLRNTRDRFDAIYVDFPAARDYNVAVLYSREFYSLVRAHLTADGFVAIDTPNGWCGRRENLWAVYDNTLRAAGFRVVAPLVSHLNVDGRRVSNALDDLASSSSLTQILPDGSEEDLGYADRRQYLRQYAVQRFEKALQEFTIAFPVRKPLNTRWHDFGVPLRVFGPGQLAFAFKDACPHEPDPTQVNSIFRPVLPEIALLSVRFP